MRSTVSDASSAGLSTSVQPVARIGPSSHHWLISGPFQGMMPPTTPTGALSVKVLSSPGSEFCSVAPEVFTVCVA